MNEYTYGEPKTKKIPDFEKDCVKLKKLMDHGNYQYGI